MASPATSNRTNTMQDKHDPTVSFPCQTIPIHSIYPVSAQIIQHAPEKNGRRCLPYPAASNVPRILPLARSPFSPPYRFYCHPRFELTVIVFPRHLFNTPFHFTPWLFSPNPAIRQAAFSILAYCLVFGVHYIFLINRIPCKIPCGKRCLEIKPTRRAVDI